MKPKKVKNRIRKIQKRVKAEYDNLSNETNPQIRLGICKRIGRLTDGELQ